MRNNDIAKLTEQLNQVRISRDRAVQRILETVKRARVTEIALLTIIRTRRVNIIVATAAANGYTMDAERFRRGNIPIIGDTVKIVNNLRDELGTVGVVTASGRKFEEIRNATTRKRYTRVF